MTRGISLEDAKLMVGDGWSDILCRLYDKLPKKTYVMQVKEKWGSLRFYIGTGSNRTFNLIAVAEKESETTCECCGKPGEIKVHNGWYLCRCPNCESKETIK